MRLFAFAAALVATLGTASAQDVAFESSNLPIVLIDTDGAEIPDEPKIEARMQIIDNGPGVRNRVTDAPNDYDGFIGIEIRGSTSQSFPKKQYGVELHDAEGEDIDASLLGMPEEEDWILQAPYSDKSLMRNVLAYDLSRQMGRYASRTRFCEVVLNGRYQGVYVLMEKIKRDDERVDLNNLKEDETEGDDLTGGYIFKLDKTTGSATVDGWTSPYRTSSNPENPIFYQFEDPDADDIVPEQAAYITGFVTGFEDAMASDDFEDPETGYPAFINLGAFVDYFLVNEVARNVDGYRLSAFFHKDKDSKDPLLYAGPVWDYNLGFGNVDYYGGPATTGYQVDFVQPNDAFPVPFWWPKLAESASFRTALQARWAELRQGPLATAALIRQVDSTATALDEAQARNFERWPVLGEYVWPNPPGFQDRDTYAAEVSYLKDWLQDRMVWLDDQLRLRTSTEPGAGAAFSLSAPWPNPSRGVSHLSLSVESVREVTVDVLDVRGRRVAQLWDGPLADGAQLSVDTSVLPAGLYLVRAVTATGTATQRLAVVR